MRRMLQTAINADQLLGTQNVIRGGRGAEQPLELLIQAVSTFLGSIVSEDCFLVLG